MLGTLAIHTIRGQRDGLMMTPEEKAQLVDEIVGIYESEPDSELEEALEKAQVTARTVEALLAERRAEQDQSNYELEEAKAFIIGEMEKARIEMRRMGKTEPEILTPDDINQIVIPRSSSDELRD